MLKTSYIESSHGKINWYLDILERREDGYHNLSTLMQKVSLTDTITLAFDNEYLTSTASSFQIGAIRVLFSMDSPFDLAPSADNTMILALAAFLAKAPQIEKLLPSTIYLHLNKNIPVQAGMGGGSSNGATVLNIMNAIVKDLGETPLSEQTLINLARSIGADVPFLTQGYMRAYCEGIGDIITAKPSVKCHKLLLLMPKFHVSTKDAFQAFAKSQSLRGALRKTSNPERFLDALDRGDYTELESLGQNAFYNLMKESMPELQQVRDRLITSGAAFATMTGSGAAFFGVFEDETVREHAWDSLSRDYLVYRADALADS